MENQHNYHETVQVDRYPDKLVINAASMTIDVSIACAKCRKETPHTLVVTGSKIDSFDFKDKSCSIKYMFNTDGINCKHCNKLFYVEPPYVPTGYAHAL